MANIARSNFSWIPSFLVLFTIGAVVSLSILYSVSTLVAAHDKSLWIYNFLVPYIGIPGLCYVIAASIFTAATSGVEIPKLARYQQKVPIIMFLYVFIMTIALVIPASQVFDLKELPWFVHLATIIAVILNIGGSIAMFWLYTRRRQSK